MEEEESDEDGEDAEDEEEGQEADTHLCCIIIKVPKATSCSFGRRSIAGSAPAKRKHTM